MKGNIEILGLFNCGVLVNSLSSSVLVDGINKELSCFSQLSDEIYQDMLVGNAPYDHLEHLVFTHLHLDHFDDERCAKLIRTGRIKKVFLPCFGLRGAAKTLEEAERSTEIISPDYSSVDRGKVSLGEHKLEFFATSHSGAENRGFPHYALLLQWGGKSCYFSSDSDYLSERELLLLQGTEIDYAFFNPYYLNHVNGRRIVAGLGAKHNVIYHIPTEYKDVFGIRKMALRDEQRFSAQLGNVRLLLEPMHVLL